MIVGNPAWPQPSFNPYEAPSMPGWLKVVLIGGSVLLLYKIVNENQRRSRAPRDTFRYQLFDGPRKVQDGITNDPARRCTEHAADGKRFTSMRVVGPVLTRTSALVWERTQIESYRQRHGGRLARYNKV